MSPRDVAGELFRAQAAEPQQQQEEMSLKVFADLAELTEEQAKVRAKVTALSTQVSGLIDGMEHTDRRLESFKSALKGVISQIENLSAADSLHSKQFGTVADALKDLDTQIQAHQNTLVFLRQSDGKQEQSIERLRQSRITLTHILLFGCLLFAGARFVFDVDKAFSFHQRLSNIEYHFYP